MKIATIAFCLLAALAVNVSVSSALNEERITTNLRVNFVAIAENEGLDATHDPEDWVDATRVPDPDELESTEREGLDATRRMSSRVPERKRLDATYKRVDGTKMIRG